MVPGPWPTGAECARWEGVDTRCGGGGHHLAGGRWKPGHPGPGLRALPCLPFNLWMEPQGAAGRSIQRDKGCPEPRQRHWAKGHWSLRRTLQSPSRCLVPSGLHSVEGSGVLVLREWAGACGGPLPPGQQEGMGWREVGALHAL